MAQAQGQGGIISAKRVLNKKRILIMIVIAIAVPGIGWLIDLVLLAWWYNNAVHPK
jgi:hypothetical protein